MLTVETENCDPRKFHKYTRFDVKLKKMILLDFVIFQTRLIRTYFNN